MTAALTATRSLMSRPVDVARVVVGGREGMLSLARGIATGADEVRVATYFLHDEIPEVREALRGAATAGRNVDLLVSPSERMLPTVRELRELGANVVAYGDTGVGPDVARTSALFNHEKMGVMRTAVGERIGYVTTGNLDADSAHMLNLTAWVRGPAVDAIDGVLSAQMRGEREAIRTAQHAANMVGIHVNDPITGFQAGTRAMEQMINGSTRGVRIMTKELWDTTTIDTLVEKARAGQRVELHIGLGDEQGFARLREAGARLHVLGKDRVHLNYYQADEGEALFGTMYPWRNGMHGVPGFTPRGGVYPRDTRGLGSEVLARLPSHTANDAWERMLEAIPQPRPDGPMFG